jgi:hypothetical protein
MMKSDAALRWERMNTPMRMGAIVIPTRKIMPHHPLPDTVKRIQGSSVVCAPKYAVCRSAVPLRTNLIRVVRGIRCCVRSNHSFEHLFAKCGSLVSWPAAG